jgi:hypothetical protein
VWSRFYASGLWYEPAGDSRALLVIQAAKLYQPKSSPLISGFSGKVRSVACFVTGAHPGRNVCTVFALDAAAADPSAPLVMSEDISGGGGSVMSSLVGVSEGARLHGSVMRETIPATIKLSIFKLFWRVAGVKGADSLGKNLNDVDKIESCERLFYLPLGASTLLPTFDTDHRPRDLPASLMPEKFAASSAVRERGRALSERLLACCCLRDCERARARQLLTLILFAPPLTRLLSLQTPARAEHVRERVA